MDKISRDIFNIIFTYCIYNKTVELMFITKKFSKWGYTYVKKNNIIADKDNIYFSKSQTIELSYTMKKIHTFVNKISSSNTTIDSYIYGCNYLYISNCKIKSFDFKYLNNIDLYHIKGDFKFGNIKKLYLNTCTIKLYDTTADIINIHNGYFIASNINCNILLACHIDLFFEKTSYIKYIEVSYTAIRNVENFTADTFKITKNFKKLRLNNRRFNYLYINIFKPIFINNCNIKKLVIVGSEFNLDNNEIEEKEFL